MAVRSVRVQHIVELVAELDDEERLELQAELGGQVASVGRAWGDEIDRRAARALRGESAPLSRSGLTALLETDPTKGRAQFASESVDERRRGFLEAADRLREALTDEDWEVIEQARMRDLR